MTIKIVAIIMFVAIVISLGSALFHLVKRDNTEQSHKTVQALSYRISLSLILFFLLFFAFATGLFQPSGIGSRIQQPHASSNQSPQAK